MGIFFVCTYGLPLPLKVLLQGTKMLSTHLKTSETAIWDMDLKKKKKSIIYFEMVLVFELI